MDWKTHLRRKTEDPVFLQKMVAIILLAGLGVGLLTQWLPKPQRDFISLRDTVKSVIHQNLSVDEMIEEARRVPTVEQLLAVIASIDLADNDIGYVAKQLLKKQVVALEGEHTPIVFGLLRCVRSTPTNDPLEQMASSSDPVPLRFANHALGLLSLRRGDLGSAAAYFEQEGKHPDAMHSRELCLECYRLTNNRQALIRLAQEMAYQELLSVEACREIAIEQRNWSAIVSTIPSLVWKYCGEGASFYLALLTGLGWFVVAVQLGQPSTEQGARLWLCGLAVATGPISIGLTDFFIVWQEMDWPIRESNDLIEGLKYYVFGVGLREEVAKLIALIPLMAWLIRRGSTQEVLMVSACVGLGFAIIENMGYFSGTGGANSLGRFLTANFLHMAMTGLIGLSAARLYWSPSQWSQSLLIMVVVVLVHGFYDAAIVLPAFADFSVASIIAFIGLSYAFFAELRTVHTRINETISQTATFLFVVCTLTAVTFAYMSWQFGAYESFKLLTADVISLGIMVYMYLREMPNSLIR